MTEIPQSPHTPVREKFPLTGDSVLTFNMNLLARQLRHPSHTPEGRIVGAADTAMSAGEHSDRTVLVSAVSD